MNHTVAEKMLDAGISPLELVRYPVLTWRDGAEQGCFTELHINSLELGTLTPAQYRVVTNRNNQSLRLSTWAFRHTVPLLSKETDGGGCGECGEWISFYLPSKALIRGHLNKLLEGERKKGSGDFSRLVVELSSELLYEDAAEASENMAKLNREFGIRFMLSEFGDEYCPIQRLPLYPVDFVLLDSTIHSAETLQASAIALKMAKQCGKTVIARLKNPVTGLPPEASPDCYIPELSALERRES